MTTPGKPGVDLVHACCGPQQAHQPAYSTVTLFARFRGLSTSVPLTRAAW